MVIEDVPVLPTGSLNKPASRTANEKLAHPADRVAALVVDFLIVLLPGLLAICAPLRRQIVEALVLDDTPQFTRALLVILAVSISLSLAYFTLTVWRLGGTVGHRMFGLRVRDINSHKRLSYSASFWRALIFLAELFLLGIPWLSVFSDRRRRVFHDKVAESVVVSDRERSSMPPQFVEATVVRSVQMALLALAVLIVGGVGVETYMHLEGGESASLWETNEGADAGGCENVSAAMSADEKDDQDRLSLAMELFAAGTIDQPCLRLEADRVLKESDDQSALAYLAKAFAMADEPEKSNEYLEHTCEVGPGSDTCLMSQVVKHWSRTSWDQVADVFKKMTPQADGHLRIWRIRYYMRQGDFAEAVREMAPLAGRNSLADFILPEKIKALYQQRKSVEAKSMADAALTSLSGEARLNLSSWMCRQELARDCASRESFSCQQFAKSAKLAPQTEWHSSTWITQATLSAECASSDMKDRSQMLETFALNVSDEGLKDYLRGLSFQVSGKVSEAQASFESLIQGEATSEEVRQEVYRQLLSRADTNHEVGHWLDLWSKESTSVRQNSGALLFDLLEKRKIWAGLQKLSEGLSKDLLDLPEWRKDMVVANFEEGRHQEAWRQLKSLDGRAPASRGGFDEVVTQLRREFKQK